MGMSRLLTPGRVLSIMLVAAIAMAALGSVSSAQPAAAAGAKTVRLAYFSVPPTDGTSVSTLAKQIDHVMTASSGFRDDLRGAGFGGESFQYQLILEAEGPGPYANSSASCNPSYRPLGNQVADQVGDFCKSIHPHEDWFLHNGAGKRLYAVWGGRVMYHMNPNSSGWRSFARSRLEGRGVKLGYTGFHFDNIELSLYKKQHQLANSDGTIKEFGSDDSFRSAMTSFLGYVTATIRPANKVWANLVCDRITGDYWSPYAQYLDGVMTEMFATGYDTLSTTQWNNQLKQVELLAKAGKGAVLIGQGAKTDTTRETFALASYLLVTDSNEITFRYSQSKAYSQWWSYSNFNVQLGAAKGLRYQSGGVWKRDFACGSVTVDPAARTGKISTTTCSGASDASVPTVTLSGVSNGQTVSGSIAVQANVTSAAGVDHVGFYLDGTEIGTESAAPYYLGGDDNGTPNKFDTRKWSDGAHTLKATATDTKGQAGSTQISITVANTASTAPTVSLSGVADGQTVSGSIAVEAKASSGTGIDHVDFYLDGTKIGTESAAPYYLGGDDNGTPNKFDTRKWSDGSHALKATATDNNGKTASAQATITVSNSAAVAVTLAGVSNNQTVADDIALQAIATSAAGIDHVDFYLDGTKIGTESAAPYYLGGDDNGTPKGFSTHQWSNGSHTLKATAVDKNSKTASSQVTITVNNFVALSGVTDGQTVSGTIKVEARIINSTAVDSVVFYLDNTRVDTESIAPFWLGGDNNGTPKGFDTRQWSNGTHLLWCLATSGGLSSSHWATITVRN